MPASNCLRRARWLCLTLKFFRSQLLLSMTILSVFLGLIAGFSLRNLNLNADTVRLVNFPGEIFMQVLKLMILPLIFSSLISALAQMDARESGRVGILTVSYYILTMIISIITGVTLVLIIHPGSSTIHATDHQHIEHSPISPLDTFLDVIRNMFPANVVRATFQRVQTTYDTKRSRVRARILPQNPSPGGIGLAMPRYVQIPLTNKTSSGDNVDVVSSALGTKGGNFHHKSIENVGGMNILGVIVFCTGFGVVVSTLGDKARIIVDFFVILESVIMRLVSALMWLAPIGIVSLIAGNLLDLEDLGDAATVLFLYVTTVLSALAIHTFVTMPLLYVVVTRRNPIRIARGMFQALVTAFGTASGGATLPISINCLEEKLSIDRRISRFVLPLGSTINMDGNALYEAVAVIFIAQLNNVTLTLAEVITVSFIATIASLGLNSVPAGLVSILVVLSSVGLPTKDVSLIIMADWLIDRVRTSVNVLGDAFIASIVAQKLGDKLERPRKKRNKRSDSLNANAAKMAENESLKTWTASSKQDAFVQSASSSPAASLISERLQCARIRRYSMARPSFDDQFFTWREQAILERLNGNVALSRVQHI